MSEQQLAEIRSREAATTKGPWGTYDDGTGRIDIAADLEETGHGYTCRRGIAQTDDDPIDNDPAHMDWDEDTDLAQSEADAQFIAHARTDVPALLAEIDRLRAELTEQQRYAAELEVAICQCEPACEGGEYLHMADCPVVPIQMETLGLGGERA